MPENVARVARVGGRGGRDARAARALSSISNLERKGKKNSPVPRSVSAVASAGDAPLFVQNNLVVRDVLVDFDLLVVDVDDLVVA